MLMSVNVAAQQLLEIIKKKLDSGTPEEDLGNNLYFKVILKLYKLKSNLYFSIYEKYHLRWIGTNWMARPKHQGWNPRRNVKCKFR